MQRRVQLHRLRSAISARKKVHLNRNTGHAGVDDVDRRLRVKVAFASDEAGIVHADGAAPLLLGKNSVTQLTPT